MLAQTVVNKGSHVTLRPRRGTRGEDFADVCMIAAAIRRAYKYIGMACVVGGQSVVRMVLVDRCPYIFFKKIPC
jgi:hypothetical protein